MQRIRAARAIAEYYKEKDPGTMVSETMIRRLMENGELPVFKNGTKKLTSIEAVEGWLEAQLGGKQDDSRA